MKFRPAKLRCTKRKMFSPKSSPYEANGFSPKTSPCEAKDVFALNFAVRSERRFRPKVRRMRRTVFRPKLRRVKRRSFRPYSTRVLSVRLSPLNSQSFAGNVAVRGDIPNSPRKFAVQGEKFVLIPKRSFPLDYHRSTPY